MLTRLITIGSFLGSVTKCMFGWTIHFIKYKKGLIVCTKIFFVYC